MSRNAFPVCFHDGAYTGLENATFHAGSIAMRYAVSVFEGIRLYRVDDGGASAPSLKAFALDAHMTRLGNSLRLMHLPDPGIDRLAEIIATLVEKNGIDDDAYIRPSVSARNPGDLSVAVESCLTVIATPMGRKTWLAQDRAMSLAISAWQRASEAVFPPAAKNISNYAGARVALLQARRDGYDGVVLTNADGFLAEAPTAALFLVRGDRLETPGAGGRCAAQHYPSGDHRTGGRSGARRTRNTPEPQRRLSCRRGVPVRYRHRNRPGKGVRWPCSGRWRGAADHPPAD